MRGERDRGNGRRKREGREGRMKEREGEKVGRGE